MSLSANGSTAGTGIVWATRALGATGGGGFNSNTPVGGILYAFDAANVTTKLWDSNMVAADKLANAPKYIAPTIANGKVYVGTLGAAPTTGGEVAVYGLLNPTDGGVGGSSGSGGGAGGTGGVGGGTPPTLTCATVDGGAPQPTTWTYVYNTYFAGTTTTATAGHCSECHDVALAGFACGADKDSCYTGLVSSGMITPANPSASPMADSERSLLAWFGRPTTPPGVTSFMPRDLVVRNPPAVAALCGWVLAGARNDKSNGQTCGGANECASGFCVGGICCANATCSATPTYQIDTGSTTAASPFVADRYSTGGTTRTVTNTITTSGVTNAAPQAVYQSERYGTSTYTIPSLTASATYTVRLHFAELYQTASGKRVFNVVINGTTVLSNFDIFAAAGATYKAVVRDFTAIANASGQIVINFNTVTDNATIEGIEIIPATANTPPTIATAASASPNPVTNKTAALSVLGADNGGESTLTYTWATIGTPPAAVSFSANGTNAAKATTATFAAAGAYSLQVTVTDQGGLTATSPVTITVNQTLTTIVVSPASATIAPSASQQFTATARDQFGVTLTSQPSFTWSVPTPGTIGATGLYTAASTAGGPYTVSAQSGSVGGTASVSVATANAAPTIATAAAASPSPVTGASTQLSVLGADDNGEASLVYTWATTGSPPAAATFSANGTNAAKASTATFTKAGTYAFQVTVKDQGNLTVTSSVNVTVNQTLTSIVVSPSSATIATSATQQFSASGRDQFATALTTQPSFTWTVSGGGTISSGGLFTAGTTAGGPFTVTAQSGSISGTAGVTVSSTPTTVYRINCGGAAVSPFTADQFSSGGTARTVTNSITLTGVTNPAPQAVYQSERYGNATYTLPSLVAAAQYKVRLHFAELYQTASGRRVFNVAINGTTVLSNFDIFAATGGTYRATVREFTTTANASGQIVITLTTVTETRRSEASRSSASRRLAHPTGS